MKNSICIWLGLLTGMFIQPFNIAVEEVNVSAQQKNLLLQLSLDDTEKIIRQTLSVSLDSPHASCGQIAITPNAQKQYLPEFSDSKEVLEKNINLTIPVHIDTMEPVSTQLHVSFLLLPNSTFTEKIINLSFNQSVDEPEHTTYTTTSQPAHHNYSTTKSHRSFTDYFQHLVQTSESLWVKLLFAFLLGLLLSLTPCIYPMIPITIGILHSNDNRSVLYNFLGSCCYAFGLSTMFSCLGLLAAFAGASFGSLLSNPIFVSFMVIFIGYMSLTMIGVIDLTIPSFLQRSTNLNKKFGPFFSAYMFGLISGSVASPCVSPGLALLLTMVATMGNIFAGFLLLFCFGIGMSTPLIIIGTFSSSMNLLPQAGQWMVEVKKGLGFIMLATCLYYLNNIVASSIMPWIIVAYLLFAALFCIIDAQKDFNPKTKTIKSLIGIILLAMTVFMSFRAYDQSKVRQRTNSEQGVQWAKNYAEAVLQAQSENKLIIIDFWANHCTICKAIDKKLFHKDIVWNGLKNKFIFVKVDCTSNANAEAARLKEQFKVFAQPAILIINPNTEKIITKWSSEPYSMTPDEFVQTVQNI